MHDSREGKGDGAEGMEGCATSTSVGTGIGGRVLRCAAVETAIVRSSGSGRKIFEESKKFELSWRVFRFVSRQSPGESRDPPVV